MKTIGTHIIPISGAVIEVNMPTGAKVIDIGVTSKGYSEFIRFVVEQDKEQPDVMRKFVLLKSGGRVEDNYKYIGKVETRHGVFLDMVYEVEPVVEPIAVEVVENKIVPIEEVISEAAAKRGRPARLEETVRTVKKNGV